MNTSKDIRPKSTTDKSNKEKAPKKVDNKSTSKKKSTSSNIKNSEPSTAAKNKSGKASNKVAKSSSRTKSKHVDKKIKSSGNTIVNKIKSVGHSAHNKTKRSEVKTSNTKTTKHTAMKTATSTVISNHKDAKRSHSPHGDKVKGSGGHSKPSNQDSMKDQHKHTRDVEKCNTKDNSNISRKEQKEIEQSAKQTPSNSASGKFAKKSTSMFNKSEVKTLYKPGPASSKSKSIKSSEECVNTPTPTPTPSVLSSSIVKSSDGKDKKRLSVARKSTGGLPTAPTSSEHGSRKRHASSQSDSSKHSSHSSTSAKQQKTEFKSKSTSMRKSILKPDTLDTWQSKSGASDSDDFLPTSQLPVANRKLSPKPKKRIKLSLSPRRRPTLAKESTEEHSKSKTELSKSTAEHSRSAGKLSIKER